MKKSKVLLIILILCLSSYTLYLFSQNLNVSQETSFAFVIEEGKADRQYMLAGKIDPSTVKWDSSREELQFILTDGEHSLSVIYNKPMSSSMDLSEVEVVVEGVYSDGIFLANKLQTRCPSKYEVK